MPLTEPQKQIFNDPARFRVAVCGRRFGKSFLAIWELARAARYPNQRVLYVAPNYRQAKSIIFDPLYEQLAKRNWIKKVNQSELTFTLINGSTIELRSADAGDSMRGLSGSFAVMDECAFYDKSIWTDVVRPLLSDQEGGCLFITTPQGQNWVYDLYLNAESLDDWSSYQYTTLDGGQVSAEEVEAAKRDLDEVSFKTEYLADFTSTSRTVFYAFDKKVNVKPVQDIGRIWVGCDMNINPMSAVIGTPTDYGFHIFDEIVMYNSNTHELAQEIKDRYGLTTVHPDPAGAAKKSSSRGKTDHDIIRESGHMVRAPKSHTKVKDRNAVVNSMLRNAAGESKLFIDPKCKNTIEALAKHQYKGDSMQPNKEDGYDHITDALAYVVDYNYSILPKADTRNKPRVFGHF